MANAKNVKMLNRSDWGGGGALGLMSSSVDFAYVKAKLADSTFAVQPVKVKAADTPISGRENDMVQVEVWRKFSKGHAVVKGSKGSETSGRRHDHDEFSRLPSICMASSRTGLPCPLSCFVDPRLRGLTLHTWTPAQAGATNKA